MNTLQRTLGLRDLVFIVVGSVIGSGIFIVPSTVLRQVGGDPAIALAVWFFAGVLSLLGALTYGELGARRPEAGGLYVYIRDAFGRFPAFLYGWTLFFVIGSGTVAALGAAFAGYLGELTPLSTVGSRVAAVLMIVAVMLINLIGTRGSAQVQNWTTAFKFTALIVMSVLLLMAGEPAAAAAPPPEPNSYGLLTGIGLSMIGVLWAYEGWQFVTFSAGEAIDPQRTLPRAIAAGTIALIFVYCLANVAYVAALGPEGVMAAEGVAAAAVRSVFGPSAGRFVALAILVSIFSATNATVLTSSRVFFAMARDGIFFRRLAEIHPRTGTPVLSILAGCTWAMVLAASGTFDQLLTYVVFTGWLFYALAAAAIFPFRRRDRGADVPFRVPGYPLTPLLFVGAAAAIVLNALFSTPLEALIGIAVVLAGAPAFVAWRRTDGNG